MPMRQGPLTRGTDRGTAIVLALMREAEAARVARGISFATIGRALRVTPAQVARILRGQSRNVSVVRVAQVLAAVGLRLSAGAFPAGAPVRDVGQVALLARLRKRIAAHLAWSEEAPVIELPTADSPDYRAWDAAIDGPGVRVRVDAETHIGDLQAVERRVALKQRDGREACVILLLADTKHHRALLDVAGTGLRERFPLSQRATLAALRAGKSPGGNAVILL